MLLVCKLEGRSRGDGPIWGKSRHVSLFEIMEVRARAGAFIAVDIWQVSRRVSVCSVSSKS